MSLLSTFILAATGVGGKPDPNGLPGTSALQSLISGVAFWALLAALAGLLDLGGGVGALITLRQLPPRVDGPTRHAHLGARRLPRGCGTSDRRVLRGPRPDRPVVMPGRDIGIRPVARERRSSGRLIAPAVAALALVAMGIAIGSRIASPQKPTVRADTTSVPEPHARTAPSAETSAPTTPTRAGAVAAAARSITAFDGDVLLDPVRLRAVVERLAAAASRPQLIRAFADASAQTRAMLGADSVPRPVVVLRSVPVGYRVEQLSGDEATVAVWYVGIVGSGATIEPQQSWRTQVVRLVWEARAWKVRSFEASAGPTPPLLSTEATTPPGDMFTAVASFAEIRDAG